MKREDILLVDNGSLRAEPSLMLRSLAADLSTRAGATVHPVSLLHSAGVDPALLDGRPAAELEGFLEERIAAGVRRFTVVPLFLGPSRALSEYLPMRAREFRAACPDLELRVADPLAGPNPDKPDPRLAEIVARQVRKTVGRFKMTRPAVAMVDHGSPVEPVTRVRNAVAGAVGGILAHEVRAVQACSMERRDGAAYDFNEPLLERVDGVPGFAGENLVVALFFLLPGRHAGAGGDVAEICEGLRRRGAFQRVRTTGLLSEDAGIVEILGDRLESVRGRGFLE